MPGSPEAAIVALKHTLKAQRQRVRDLKGQNDAWRSVVQMLRSLAGIPDDQFKNLLKAKSLPCDRE